MRSGLSLMVVFFMLFSACDNSNQTMEGDIDCQCLPDGDTVDRCDTSESEREKEPIKSNTCETNADCADFGKNYSCHNEKFECILQECRTHEDCDPIYGKGYYCDKSDGEYLCYPPPHNYPTDDACGSAKVVRINQPAGMIREGESIQLTATALNANGAKLQILDPSVFVWSSSDDTKVSIDSNGVITGGKTDGAAAIKVTLGGTCPAGMEDTVEFVNYTKLTTGGRVVVFDSTTGAKVPDGTKVYFAKRGEVSEPVLTDNGTALFPNLDCTDGCDLHVASEYYNYVSALGLTKTDIIVPLMRYKNKMVAPGVKGKHDLSKMPELLKDSTQFGFTGFSIFGNLADFDFIDAIGEKRPLDGSNLPSIELPDDLVLSTGLEGYMGATALKEGFEVSGIPGTHTLWGLGGYMNLNEVMGMVTKATSEEEELDLGGLFTVLMPLLDNFYHGLTLNIDLPETPKIPDIDDANLNGKTNDLIADFSKFASVDMIVSQRQKEVAIQHFGTLPTKDGKCEADSLVSITGCMQTGVGFIPLGFSGVFSSKDENALTDCNVGENGNGFLKTAYAPQHSGISGYPYKTMGIATNINDLFDKSIIAADYSVAFGNHSVFDSNIELALVGNFMPYLSGFEYSVKDRGYTLTTNEVKEASFYRVVFEKEVIEYEDDDNLKPITKHEKHYWHIYWSEPGISFKLPDSVEMRDENHSEFSKVQAIEMKAHNKKVGLDELMEFNTININNMNNYLTAFSTHYLKQEKEK